MKTNTQTGIAVAF